MRKDKYTHIVFVTSKNFLLLKQGVLLLDCMKLLCLLVYGLAYIFYKVSKCHGNKTVFHNIFFRVIYDKQLDISQEYEYLVFESIVVV